MTKLEEMVQLVQQHLKETLAESTYIRLVDKYAGTNGIKANGMLYNEPPIPSYGEVQTYLADISFPMTTKINISILMVRAEKEMKLLRLSESTEGQYRHTWREISIYVLLKIYSRSYKPL